MPPRLGGPASAPQRGAGGKMGKAEIVRPAAKPLCSNSRRLIPVVWWEETRCVCIGIPPCGLEGCALRPDYRSPGRTMHWELCSANVHRCHRTEKKQSKVLTQRRA